MQYTSHYVLGNSHDKMITVFLVIIAAAELQGHKPWRENAGQVCACGVVCGFVNKYVYIFI